MDRLGPPAWRLFLHRCERRARRSTRAAAGRARAVVQGLDRLARDGRADRGGGRPFSRGSRATTVRVRALRFDHEPAYVSPLLARPQRTRAGARGVRASARCLATAASPPSLTDLGGPRAALVDTQK